MASPDLLVANDSTPNYLYRNKGDGTFEDLSFESGYAVNRGGTRNGDAWELQWGTIRIRASSTF